jgi:tight adherence protein B
MDLITWLLIIFFVLVAVGIYFFSQIIPVDKYFNKFKYLQHKRVEKFSSQLEDIFYKPSYKLILLFILSPLIGAGLGFVFMNNLISIVIGALIGFIIPSLIIKILKKKREEKFNEQLIDGLMEISNYLKGGLSILQALEEMTKRNQPPLKDEFSLALRANKMGVPLEECLEIMNKRMNSEYLQLMTNAILVGKETGGNLISVFSKLTATIRERKKLKDKINLLTFQGRLQAIIIFILPFVFTATVYKMDPHHFDVMLETELGRIFLIAAGALQLFSLFLIVKFSSLRY